MGSGEAPRNNPRKVWRVVLKWPALVLFLAALVVFAAGSGVLRVKKDPSVDAFVPAGHPAALARDKAKAIFGLEDPIIVGLAAPRGASAFTVPTLEALREIAAEVRALPNVDKNGLRSVASENAMSGEGGDLAVDPILADGPVTEETAALAFERVMSMPMMVGLLASKSGDTLTLIVPVFDPNDAEETYLSIKTIAERAAPPTVTAHVAGVAAMNGRLARMVSEDTRIFVPMAVLVAVGILWIALRRWSGLVGPMFVIAGSTAIAVGIMGFAEGRYYLITTALPVIIMAIAIADSLHISTIYLRERAREPALDAKTAIARALDATFLPVTLTTVTTVAGFAGLAIGSPMRPISEFGWFAGAGVAAAWFLSVTALPAIILMLDLRPRPGGHEHSAPLIDGAISAVTQWSLAHPKRVAAGLLAILGLFAFFAASARFDYMRKDYFVEQDAARVADAALNERLSGLNFLDLVIRSPEPEGLLAPAAVASVSALKDELVSEPLVNKTTAIDDYVVLMHEILAEAPKGALPAKANAPAQYLLLYEASGDPGDFDAVIDYDYQNALVRAQLSTDQFTAVAPAVDAFEAAAARFSAETGLQAEVSGRIAVNDGWMSVLSDSHFKGLALAGVLVFLASALAFQSLAAAGLAFVPVATGVLFTHAAMGAMGIDIGPATSMTAAIATGLGVDFGVHLISHARKARALGADWRSSVSGNYVVVARACFYSAIALAVALCVICLSSAPPLRWFGALVAAAAIGSLVGALFILPAVYGLMAERSRPASSLKEIYS